nr:hypothetical protein [Tanacetum cinerariifolium]
MPTDIPTLRQYSRRAKISQSSALPIAADEHASPLGDESQGEAFPTISSLEAEQDRDNIIKTSALPHDSPPRVTSLATDEGNATSILTSGVQVVSVLAAAEVATVSVPTGSGLVPTASLIFTTASVVTPYSRRKGKEKMVESNILKKKKLQEQIDVQMAREMEEQLAREDQRMNEQIARDAKIARIHAEEELQMLIDGLDRNNETIASAKKMNTSVEVSKEVLKEMMQLVLVEEVYVEALQVKHPIIDWEIYSEGQRIYWKIIRLGGYITVYQFFVDMLKHFDRKDLTQLWTLVKETLSIKQATSDKEKELWVELKRLYKPDVEDQFDEFPLLDYFPIATKDKFPLLSERDAPAEEVCTAADVKKWHLNENLLKEDVYTIPVWVKLYGVSVTDFNEDGLSAIATKLAIIELRADVEVKDDIVMDMLKITWEGHYICDFRVKYEWKPHRCESRMVFGHIHVESLKNTVASEKKSLKKPSQTCRGVLVGSEIADNDVMLGTNGGITNLVNKGATSSRSSFMNVNNSSTGRVSSDYDSENEVASVDNDMARSMASKRDLPQELQAICDNLDIRV